MAEVYTHAGKTHVAGLFAKTVASPASYYIGWGTGAGTSAQGDTSLFIEDTTDGRVAASESAVTTTQTNDTSRFVATLTATGSKTITNGGVWDQNDPGGTLVLKADHAGVPLLNADSIEYTFDLQQTQV